MNKILFALFVLLSAMLTTSAQHLKKTVAQDGSGDYSTVQAAFDAIPAGNNRPVSIFIKKGIYREKLFLDSLKRFVTLLGEDKFNTILIYDDHTGKVSPKGDTIRTRSSYSFLIKAADFSARNISFENDAGTNAGQAVALESDGDRAVFINCRFIGFQDVLYINNPQSRQYFRDCYIEGTTDFIFGSATVWFQQCHIHCKKDSYITAASTPREHAFGYVLYDCILTGDTTVHQASLGRPWRPYAAVVYLHCFVGAHIKADGWSNWNNTQNFTTARYAEYKNYGPSANAANRVSWSKQLTSEETEQYTVNNVLGDWNPDK